MREFPAGAVGGDPADESDSLVDDTLTLPVNASDPKSKSRRHRACRAACAIKYADELASVMAALAKSICSELRVLKSEPRDASRNDTG